MPRPTRSSDSSMSRACCFVSTTKILCDKAAAILTNQDPKGEKERRGKPRHYNFTASAFAVAHSIGRACGIKPRFAAYAKYNSRPRRFSASREKSMLLRKYDSRVG